MRQFPSQQRLKEIVVTNFLNVFKLGVIVFMVSLLTFGLLYHRSTIKKNSEDSEETIEKSAEDHWQNLMIMVLLETIIQSYSFISNPALR
jgi:hypothetical protein